MFIYALNLEIGYLSLKHFRDWNISHLAKDEINGCQSHAIVFRYACYRSFESQGVFDFERDNLRRFVSCDLVDKTVLILEN